MAKDFYRADRVASAGRAEAKQPLGEGGVDVRIQNVSKDFNALPALHDVSLDIRPGELIALLGPSGSGKTTLLRLIAGLDFPNTGTIWFADEDASKKRVQDRNIGFVFQHYALFRHMTVLANVGFGLRVRTRKDRWSKKAIDARARELLELVQLPGLEKRYPHQLSGGQRQRVALARALAIEPKVLLLDEPFGALDAQVRKELRRWLREIHDATGHTTVFVTHDQEEALELADRVVVMNRGRIEQVGAPEEVYDTPNSASVFAFIGESSHLPVTISGGQLYCAGHALGLNREELADGTGKLFFRPHDVEIIPGDEPALAGSIIASRRTAGTRQVDIVVDGIADPVTVEVPASHPATIGSRIAFRPGLWSVFPD